MNVNALARELANVQIETGYLFQDGTPFSEKLGEERARRVLLALQRRGYSVRQDRPPDPSRDSRDAA
jgi:hypothetical protein